MLNTSLVPRPLIQGVCHLQYNARILKAIRAGVGLGLGPRLIEYNHTLLFMHGKSFWQKWEVRWFIYYNPCSLSPSKSNWHKAQVCMKTILQRQVEIFQLLTVTVTIFTIGCSLNAHVHWKDHWLNTVHWVIPIAKIDHAIFRAVS